MKITVEYFEGTITIEKPDYLEIDSLVNVFRILALGMSFPTSLVNKYLINPNDPIKVTVKGGIAECDSPLVEIVDLDNEKKE